MDGSSASAHFGRRALAAEIGPAVGMVGLAGDVARTRAAQDIHYGDHTRYRKADSRSTYHELLRHLTYVLASNHKLRLSIVRADEQPPVVYAEERHVGHDKLLKSVEHDESLSKP